MLFLARKSLPAHLRKLAFPPPPSKFFFKSNYCLQQQFQPKHYSTFVEYNQPPPEFFPFSAPERRKRRRKFAAAIAAFCLILWLMTSLDKTPTGRYRLLLFSRKLENEVAQENFNRMAKTHPLLPIEHPYTALIKKIAGRLLNAPIKEFPNESDWRIMIVNSPMVNALCLSGGQLVVFKGLIDFLRDEDEIASVLAHEIAHSKLRHYGESASKQIFQFGRYLLALLMVPFGIPAVTLYEMHKALSFSRELELEADYVGFKILTSACYNPYKAISAFEKMDKAAAMIGVKLDEKSELYQTHPTFKRRIEQYKQLLPEALQQYKEKCVR